MNNVVESLVKEASSNPVSNAMFHVFALRKRARNRVNLNSLYLRMTKEGFTYSRSEYIPGLKLLVSLGLCDQDVNHRGRFIGIKNIKVTLQSIGAAACNKNTDIANFKQRNKFQTMMPKPEILKQSIKQNSLELSLDLTIDNNVIHLPLPKSLTSEQISLLINKLKQG